MPLGGQIKYILRTKYDRINLNVEWYDVVGGRLSMAVARLLALSSSITGR